MGPIGAAGVLAFGIVCIGFPLIGFGLIYFCLPKHIKSSMKDWSNSI
jgi:hypothetical protein